MTIPNQSPWIQQLNRTRPVVPLSQHIETDVAIVGGGIAGVVTAYFTLKHTDKEVVIIEADKIAHGATGHNAGQITPYIEKPMHEIVMMFGEKMAVEGAGFIDSGWDLMGQIFKDANLKTPYYTFTGYDGYTSIPQLLAALENNLYRANGGLKPQDILISDTIDIEAEIPKKYEALYKTVPHENILELVESNNKDCIGCAAYTKGCMNSALFSEELIGYLIAEYPDRFQFFEESLVKKIFLMQSEGVLKILKHTVTAGKIVLCTNGFENFNIINEAGDDIDSKFHHLVNGRIGYMSGYLEPVNHPPTAISYFLKQSKSYDDPTGEFYFYLTRRPHENESRESFNLICGSGPETVLPNHARYSREESCVDEKQEEIDELFQENYKNYSKGGMEYAFCWHGLMGYTPNGIRRVGFEPINKVLLYNLGCNGVGILPSIYGGKRISQLLNGETLTPSIFDPHDPRQEFVLNVNKDADSLDSALEEIANS